MSDMHTIISTLKWASQKIDAEVLAAKVLAHATEQMLEAKRTGDEKRAKWLAAMAAFQKAQAEADSARRGLSTVEHDVPEWRSARFGPKERAK